MLPSSILVTNPVNSFSKTCLKFPTAPLCLHYQSHLETHLVSWVAARIHFTDLPTPSSASKLPPEFILQANSDVSTLVTFIKNKAPWAQGYNLPVPAFLSLSPTLLPKTYHSLGDSPLGDSWLSEEHPNSHNIAGAPCIPFCMFTQVSVACLATQHPRTHLSVSRATSGFSSGLWSSEE